MNESTSSPSPRVAFLPCALLVLCAVVMFGGRLWGPSALYRFDQPKTATYTADMVVNGRWLLPRDVRGQASTKPPLVNWLAAPVVHLGFWTEWALKSPMLAGAIATLLLCVWEGRRLLEKTGELAASPQLASGAASVAGIAWLTNPANLAAIYHCRPDPLLVCWLAIGWILGTRIVDPAREPSTKVVLGFWLSVGLAALTKGPPAVLPVLYLPLAAWLLHGRLSLVQRSRWWWGLPLALGLFLAWLAPLALRYPEHVRTVLVGKELLAPALGLGGQFDNGEVTSDGPVAILTTAWQNPWWFLLRFAPWSVAAMAALGVLGPRRWFRHPLGPAILWLLLVVCFFSVSAHKTADYLLPAYPAAAILAAWFCSTQLQRVKVRTEHVAFAGLALSIGITVDNLWFSNAARERVGENVKEFATGVQAIAGSEPIAFIDTGYNTLQFFLHRHQPGAPTDEMLAQARWIIMPWREGSNPVVVSGRIAAGSAKASRRPPLALYRAEDLRDSYPRIRRRQRG